MYLTILSIILLSIPVWAQHSGHGQTPPPAARPGEAKEGSVPAVRDAIKALQEIFRDLEKAALAGNESRLAETASRYESSIADVMRSVEAAEGSPSFAKDLDLAQKGLTRQLQQIQQMAAAAPPSAEEVYRRLTDAVILGPDELSAQQESIRGASASGGGAHHSGTGHGCGSMRRILF